MCINPVFQHIVKQQCLKQEQVGNVERVILILLVKMWNCYWRFGQKRKREDRMYLTDFNHAALEYISRSIKDIAIIHEEYLEIIIHCVKISNSQLSVLQLALLKNFLLLVIIRMFVLNLKTIQFLTITIEKIRNLISRYITNIYIYESRKLV